MNGDVSGTDQVVLPALRGVLGVPLLVGGSHGGVHVVGRVTVAAVVVVVVAWVTTPVPTPPPDPGKLKHPKKNQKKTVGLLE